MTLRSACSVTHLVAVGGLRAVGKVSRDRYISLVRWSDVNPNGSRTIQTVFIPSRVCLTLMIGLPLQAF
jgi:hypothetical protein